MNKLNLKLSTEEGNRNWAYIILGLAVALIIVGFSKTDWYYLGSGAFLIGCAGIMLNFKK